MKILKILLFFATIPFSMAAQNPTQLFVAKEQHILQSVSFEKVELTDPFWTSRIQTQKNRLVPVAFERVENAVEDLRRTAAFIKGEDTPLPSNSRFDISDLFKVMEGAAYLLKMERDTALEQKMDNIIAIIGEAQLPDGYLYPAHITGSSAHADHWGGAGMGDKPYSWLVHSHEIYDMGHLYEAAIAYYQATGKTTLLQIAEKNAEHINKVIFEGGDPNYNNGNPVNQAPGHEEPELALVKLYRLTGKPLYLEMAKKFIDIRGVTYQPNGAGVMAKEYAQQHKPVREQTEAVGHAVRATYLYSGMADVSNYTGDTTLRPALHAIWSDIVNTRMHITGGLGAVHGIEGFGPQYVLPNANAFDETCAAVGNVFFNHRLFMMEKDGKYMDVAEIALLNNALAGVNLAGDKFFYINPLEHNGVRPFNQGVNGRFDWFGTACCPSNIARLTPQIAGMMYTHTDNDIYCAFYSGSRVEIPLKNGKVNLEQTSAYPFDGKITLKIRPLQKNQSFTVKMRIPTWAQNRQFVPGMLYHYHSADGQNPEWTLKVNGKVVSATVEKGFVSVSRKWKVGDVVELYLPMPVRFTQADEKVEADRGRIAVTRGPLVYCAEGVDNAEDIFSYFVANKSVKTTIADFREPMLKGVRQVIIPAESVEEKTVKSADLKLIPYYAWNNRGAAKMIVWLPETENLVRSNFRFPPSFIAGVSASHTNPDNRDNPETPDAVVDGYYPEHSFDTSIPRWTSWRQTGISQCVTIKFKRNVDIQNILVYWYEDNGGVRTPKSWNIEYKKQGEWTAYPVYVSDYYGTERNKFNPVHPGEQILTDAIRLNITPKPDFAVGILEIIVEEIEKS
jgi:DUF1680 family protein